MTDTLRPKSVLGKGLSALIPRGTVRDEAAPPVLAPDSGDGNNTIVAIEVAKVKSNPYQPRLDFDPQALDELKRSIVEKGVIQPITVRRTGSGEYELISGERRIRASKDAGLKTIPAYVIYVKSDEEMLELALIENLQREHLNPIEVAVSYQRLIDECRFTQEEVAQKIGKDRSTVTNFLRLLKLPEKIQNAVRKGELSMGHARSLITLTDEKIQMRLFEKIARQHLSVRQVEELVKDVPKKNAKAPHRLTIRRNENFIQEFESKLRESLGTKVTIRPKSGEAGEIVVEYYTGSDLERLIELMEQ
jgi:ParB family transcriptional regulator, chromosome partitioning protein